MTEHDERAPLTEDDVAALESLIQRIHVMDKENYGPDGSLEGDIYDKDGILLPLIFKHLPRLVADWRRQRAELAELWQYTNHLHRIIDMEWGIDDNKPNNAESVSAWLKQNKDELDYDVKWYSKAAPRAVFEPIRPDVKTSGGIVTQPLPGEPHFHVGQRVHRMGELYTGTILSIVGDQATMTSDLEPGDTFTVSLSLLEPAEDAT